MPFMFKKNPCSLHEICHPLRVPFKCHSAASRRICHYFRWAPIQSSDEIDTAISTQSDNASERNDCVAVHEYACVRVCVQWSESRPTANSLTSFHCRHVRAMFAHLVNPSRTQIELIYVFFNTKQLPVIHFPCNLIFTASQKGSRFFCTVRKRSLPIAIWVEHFLFT